MTIKEYVTDAIHSMDDTELREVADYLAYLKFARARAVPRTDSDVAALYAQFGDEDRIMAEEGLADYAQSLAAEDAR